MICNKHRLKRSLLTTVILMILMILATPAFAQTKDGSLDLDTLTTLSLKNAKAIAIQGNPSLQATRTPFRGEPEKGGLDAIRGRFGLPLPCGQLCKFGSRR